MSYRLWPVDLWFGLLSRLQRVVVRVKFNTGWVSAHASDGRQILKALDNDAEAMLRQADGVKDDDDDPAKIQQCALVPEPTVVPSTAAASVTAASFEVLIKSQVTSVHSGIGTGNVLTYLWRAVDRRCVKVWRWTQRKFPRHLAACSRLAL